LFECCGGGQRARLADQCLEVVVEFEVGFETAGEPVVSSDLLAAVEDHQVVGVQQDPTCRPISRTGTESRRIAANTSNLAPGHAAAPSDKQHTPPHPPTIVAGPELPGTWIQFRDQACGGHHCPRHFPGRVEWRKRA
jgi:hypothetical protein